MTENNNSYSVENIVNKYCNYVNAHSPIGVDFLPNPDGTMCKLEVNVCESNGSASLHLLAVLYSNVMGADANSQVVEIMDCYARQFYEDVLTEEELAYLCKHFGEVRKYLASINYHKGLCLGLTNKPEVIKANIPDLSNCNVLLYGDAEVTAMFPNCKFPLHESSLNLDSQTEEWINKCNIHLTDSPQNNSVYALDWAIQVIMHPENYVKSKSAVCNFHEEESPELESQDFIIGCGMNSVLDNDKASCDHSHGTVSWVEDKLSVLKPNGKMLLIFDLNDMFSDKSAYLGDVFKKLVAERKIKSVITYGEYKYEDRMFSSFDCFPTKKVCILIYKSGGCDSIRMTDYDSNKSVVVTYDDIAPDYLLPNYYLAQKTRYESTLSSIASISDGKISEADLIDENRILRNADLGTDFLGAELNGVNICELGTFMEDTFNKYKELYKGEEHTLADVLVRGLKSDYLVAAPNSVLLYCKTSIDKENYRVGYVNDLDTKLVYKKNKLNLVPKDGIDSRYLAAVLLDEDVKRQIMELCYGDVNVERLSHVMDKIFVPGSSPKERDEYLISAQDAALKQSKTESKRNFENYRKAVRMRKHALSQSLSAVSSMFNSLDAYRKRHGGLLSDGEQMSRVTGKTVNDVFEAIGDNMSDVMVAVDHIADVEYSFGKTEIIDPKEFICNYIDEKDKKSVNFKFKVEDRCQGRDKKPELFFPKNALRIVFDNILSNAMAHGFTDESRDDYELLFTWCQQTDRVVVEVANNGTPIPANRDTVSLLEYGVSSALHHDGHNGIGCHEIDDIMHRYNGSIELRSTPEEKYTVTYVLTFQTNEFDLHDEEI